MSGGCCLSFALAVAGGCAFSCPHSCDTFNPAHCQRVCHVTCRQQVCRMGLCLHSAMGKAQRSMWVPDCVCAGIASVDERRGGMGPWDFWLLCLAVLCMLQLQLFCHNAANI